MQPLNLLVVGLEAMWGKCCGACSHSVMGGGEGDTSDSFHCNNVHAHWEDHRERSSEPEQAFTEPFLKQCLLKGVLQTLLGKEKFL